MTAFTVESYSWLQEDPTNTTNGLLSQISLQLSSFQMSQGFINATIHVAPQSITSSTFQPDSDDVIINFLWFLSLTLSLLAAFFAIAVQQWLRALSIPRHLSASDSIRLRQQRWTALRLFQVPNIIACLPVLLQIAVVAFLVGQWVFLRSLSHPITIMYTFVAGIPFLLWTISLFLPLIWPSCPFKSPLALSIVFVVNWLLRCIKCTIVLCLVPLIGVLFPVLLLLSFLEQYAAFGLTRFLTYIQDKILAFTRIAMNDPFHVAETFWADREIAALFRSSDARKKADITAALAWAPHAVPGQQLWRLWSCVRSLPVKDRTRCTVDWAVLHFGNFDHLGYHDIAAYSPIDIRVICQINDAFASQYEPYLLEALPTEWTSCDWIVEAPCVSCIMVLLTRIAVDLAPSQSHLRPTLVPILLQACQSQQIRQAFSARKLSEMSRYPMICLFHCTTGNMYRFTVQRKRLISSSDCSR